MTAQAPYESPVTDAMVERAAKALQQVNDCSLLLWDELPDYGKDRLRDQARAALTAALAASKPAGEDLRGHMVDSYLNCTRQAQAQGSEVVDWKALYRFERAMRFMDNKAAMTRDDAYRMADQDIAGMEWHARQTGESPDRTDTAAHAQAAAARAQDAETDDYLLHALANAVEAIPVPREGFKAGWRDEEIWEWALRTAARAIRSTTRDGVAERDYAALQARIAELEARNAASERDAGRLDYIERTFSGMTNRERYLPVQMVWGRGANGRTLREACDKYMARDAAIDAHAQGQENKS